MRKGRSGMQEWDIAKPVLEQCLSSCIPGVKRTRKNAVFSSFRPLQQILHKAKRMAHLPSFQRFLILTVQPAPIRKGTFGAAHSKNTECAFYRCFAATLLIYGRKPCTMKQPQKYASIFCGGCHCTGWTVLFMIRFTVSVLGYGKTSVEYVNWGFICYSSHFRPLKYCKKHCKI